MVTSYEGWMEVGLPVLTRLCKSFGSLAKTVIDALRQSLAIRT